MAYLDEEEVWRCTTHPSEQRRRHGVCPLCLRDKLINLCPNCANVRPCNCPEQAEPIFKRSFSLLRSKSTHKTSSADIKQSSSSSSSASSSSIWSKLRATKREKVTSSDKDDQKSKEENKKQVTMMTRSKSVGMPLFLNFGSSRESRSTEKTSKGWFASQKSKALKQSKVES